MTKEKVVSNKISSSAKASKFAALTLHEVKDSTIRNFASAAMPGTQSWQKSSLFISCQSLCRMGSGEFTLSLFTSLCLLPIVPSQSPVIRSCSRPSSLCSPCSLSLYKCISLSLFHCHWWWLAQTNRKFWLSLQIHVCDPYLDVPLQPNHIHHTYDVSPWLKPKLRDWQESKLWERRACLGKEKERSVKVAVVSRFLP